MAQEIASLVAPINPLSGALGSTSSSFPRSSFLVGPLSRFEPCGLTQLYGLRYGTVPLVALTGGLADTVINASPAALARGVATGIQFSPVDAATLRNALSRLCTLYKTPQTWSRIQANAMAQPVGWDQSAQAYADLYAGLTTTR